MKYPSFTMGRVVESKVHKGSAGYGFVAFSNALEGVKAMKEMNGKLCGSRPMKIQRSEWMKKEESYVRKKERKEKKEIKSIAKARANLD
ncbi:uncharacterized protein [Blastocystis hominis]|uniref:RRM domain-containing protein n=1 Tax=Blastocystis hominis TaxID=12968 RepID=D8LVF3_BLAHO|nr:uncharacterized protein [Blastocystis hominis]CBK19792.2 unnamed protein product [Blastocystis hominis]|eukprot:XP_012893840.1 uncharacterized protein [Blastocystis hominis]